MTLVGRPIEFTVPDSSIATLPAERRASGRDDIRLMIAHRARGSIEHDRFPFLDQHLSAGDGIVVNASATVPAAVEARTEADRAVMVHFDSPYADGLWYVEVRSITTGGGSAPGPDLGPQSLDLPGGASVRLLTRSSRSPRLWIAALSGMGNPNRYLSNHGQAIRYVPGAKLPMSDYQTVFAIEPGSAEMPSAGRPFTPEMVTRLVAQGVAVLPVVLHTGVSSYEHDETPGEERFEVPASTAVVANGLRSNGGRIVAVGTTVVRALETVADETGHLHAGVGLTDVVVTPERGVRAVDGLLTGWHEPRSSHLGLLEALAGRELLQRLYDEAVAAGYLWHEFGDELLILP